VAGLEPGSKVLRWDQVVKEREMFWTG